MEIKYPDLSESKVLSFDIETYDPELQSMGPGVYRRDGNILGIALADEQGFSEYYDIGHSKTPQETKNKNRAFIRSVLGMPMKKLGQSILYDLDWLENWAGIKVCGPLLDIQCAETLLNENQGNYHLDFMGQKYLEVGKKKHRLEEWCTERGLKGDFRNHLYLAPVELVSEYAEEDAILPINIFQVQWELLKKEHLTELFDLEMGLYPLLLQMRKQGVRVDSEKVNKGIQELTSYINENKDLLYKKFGSFNYNSSKQLAIILDKLNIQYPLTALDNPNLDKISLKHIGLEHEIANRVLELREADKILGTFFINSFSQHQIQGRLHCSFYPFKTEEYGTKSGRFSSANPNLQQIPSREETYGKLCRSVFISEEDCYWGKIDYSQIEYRLIAHYAIGPKSEDIRKQYNEDPTTDYHKLIMEWTGMDRKKSKVLNFGMAYFMGAEKFARTTGWSLEESKQLIAQYNKEVPFLSVTRNHIVKIARGRGYLRTILNRRARISPEMQMMKKEYSLFNRLIQGSAADILKKAMRDSYKAGIFNVLIPHLTVHDELDFSVPKTKEAIEANRELKHIMETCIELKVPLIADAEIGTSWGECEKFDYEKLLKEI